jgi:glucose-fructose oxidoreductase
MRTWKIAGIDFDHFHMGDNLRMAFEHPRAEILGLCDEQPERMRSAAENFGVPNEHLFTDYRRCLDETRPDLVLLCPATARHAEWVERVAPFGVHVLIEKPFAASLAEADRMIAAMQGSGKLLAINWPLAWYPCHVTAKRLLDEGTIGELVEVHYYDGNRGPLWHLADKVATTAESVAREKPRSWFYRRALGGGSLLDYLGYGATLGTWYHGGRAPLEVTAVVDEPPGLEVDEHSITIARYERGLSKFETRWGTFSDPWTHQPQPRCGFVLVGERGTISSYDFQPTVTVQTAAHPEGRELAVDELASPRRNPVEYVLHCIEAGEPLAGPLSPALSRVGQQIVDAAVQSAREKRTVRLTD